MEELNMSETDIMNFTYNFLNLIGQKDNKIAKLTDEIQILKGTVRQLQNPGKRLSVDEIRWAKRPVFCIRIGNVPKRIRKFYGIPAEDQSGVIGPKKGIYRYEDYSKTWEAFSEMPTEESENEE